MKLLFCEMNNFILVYFFNEKINKGKIIKESHKTNKTNIKNINKKKKLLKIALIKIQKYKAQ